MTDQLVERLSKASVGYHPRPDLQGQFRKKKLVGIIGPSAVGKSTCINSMVRQDKEFAKVQGFTTRPLRPGESRREHRHPQHNDDTLEHLIKKVSEGGLVQFVVHDNGYVYGSEMKDYPKAFNVLDCTAAGWQQARELSFAKVIGIALVTEPDIWVPRSAKRRTQVNPEVMAVRLAADADSLVWCLEQGDDITWLADQNTVTWQQSKVFHPAAQEAIDIARGLAEPNPAARVTGERLLRAIQTELA